MGRVPRTDPVEESWADQEEHDNFRGYGFRPEDAYGRGAIPAALHQMTANASCIAWLP